MERDLYTDDLEQLIRSKTDQHRMYPSNHVWKNIYYTLHLNKKRYWVTIIIILIGIFSFISVYLLNESFTRKLTSNIHSSINIVNQNFNNSLTNSFQPSANIANDISNTTIRKNLRLNISPYQIKLKDRSVTKVLPPNQNTRMENKSVKNFTTTVLENAQDNSMVNEIFYEKSNNNIFLENEITLANLTRDSNNLQETNLINTTDKEHKTVSNIKNHTAHEPVSLKAKHKRISISMYISPTANYRKLRGSGFAYQSSLGTQGIPLVIPYGNDVSQYVNHKPALGIQTGVNIAYQYSKWVKFRTGVQFDYSQYNIKAYYSQPEVATIALNSAGRVNSIRSVTNISNFGGLNPEELTNQYMQVSIPTGVDIKLLGNKKLQLNAALTLQPTYLLNRSLYVISTDYKNYIKEPPTLIRKWNINAGIETYLTYSTETINLQIGPQFRYQLFSSFTDKYPIKEYLRGYGLKIGIIKPLK